MKTSEHLAIVFGSLAAVLLFVGCALFYRFRFRRATRKTIPRDPAFEARLKHLAEGEEGEAPKSIVFDKWIPYPIPGEQHTCRRSWFRRVLTRLRVGVGPNRTK